MVTKSGNLTSKQIQAIEMILAGSTMVEVSVAIGRSRKTIYSWYSNPFFTKTISDERSLAFDRLSQKLQNLSEKALETLDHAMDQESVAPIRVRAAEIIISKLLTMKDQVEFEKRISTLETAVRQKQR